MSLYIKLHTTFWSHRKTMLLADILGNEGICVAPKLWCYAATHQPDGDFSDYTDGQLNMLLGYPKDAPSIRQAMCKAGFMDANFILHDWKKHNSYHVKFAARARKAAKARWGKRRKTVASEVSSLSSSLENDSDKETSNSLSDASSIKKNSAVSHLFQTFWEAYPRKVGKKVAWAAFKKHCSSFTIESLIAAIAHQKLSEQWSKDGGKYIPNPATWLNQGRWDDELPPAVPINQGPNI